jgi:hypothetical protein
MAEVTSAIIVETVYTCIRRNLCRALRDLRHTLILPYLNES